MKRYEALFKIYLPLAVMGFSAIWLATDNLKFALFMGLLPLVFWWFTEVYLELRK